MTITRRDALVATGGATLVAAMPSVRTAKGIEGQRKPDLGDGRFLNPLLAGDHPDPAILKDGADYMTFSSFDSYPGLVIHHSRDLVNWRPIGPALRRNIGSVWAVGLESTTAVISSTFRSRAARTRSSSSTPTGYGAERGHPPHRRAAA